MRITNQGRWAAGQRVLLLAVGAGVATCGWLAAGGTEHVRPPAVGTALGPAEPARIRIPRIGVDAPVTEVGLDDQGHLAPPSESDRNLAGWYHYGVCPGQVGTAVVLGRADTRHGPAVFRRLGALHRGDLIDITRSDRRTARFAVDAVAADATSGFPDDRAYAAAADARLRLVTRGGDTTGAHGDVVIYAHLAGTE